MECNKWINHHLHEASFIVYVYDPNFYIFMEGKLILLLVIYVNWRVPNSLKDSNVSPKQKTTEEQGVRARSLAHNTLEG